MESQKSVSGVAFMYWWKYLYLEKLFRNQQFLFPFLFSFLPSLFLPPLSSLFFSFRWKMKIIYIYSI